MEVGKFLLENIGLNEKGCIFAGLNY